MTEIQHGEIGCDKMPNEVFRCPKCQRVCCYCFGAADDHLELCDDCAVEMDAWNENQKDDRSNR